MVMAVRITAKSVYKGIQKRNNIVSFCQCYCIYLNRNMAVLKVNYYLNCLAITMSRAI